MVSHKVDWTAKEREAERTVLYEALLDRNEGKIFAIILPIAILLHVVLLLVHLPAPKPIMKPVPRSEGLVTKILELKPPPLQQPLLAPPPPETSRRIPFPDPDPAIESLAPVLEPMVAVEISEATTGIDEFIIEIGDIDAPPTSEPTLPGVNGVTVPVLLAESKVAPDYPELARRIRVEGNVVLQAVIRADGTVEELTVLRCTRPNMGFEQAAIDAVQRWLYEPATQDGVPVDVYFTVFVDFRLH